MEGSRLVLRQAMTPRFDEKLTTELLRARVIAEKPVDRSCMIEQGAETGWIGGVTRRRARPAAGRSG